MTEAELAQLGGVSVDEVRRLVASGILPSDSAVGFVAADVHKIRLAQACEAAGLSLTAIGSLIRDGHLSLTFLEHPVYGQWAGHVGRSFTELADDSGLSLELLGAMREAAGFARPSPEDPVRADDLKVVPILQLWTGDGFDPVVIVRMLRVYGQCLARIAEAEGAAYRSHLEEPFRDAGEMPSEAMRLGSELTIPLVPALEEALLAIYRRQQEHVWLQNIVVNVERALESQGMSRQVDRPAAMCFLDLVGYTRLTEREGDEAAARLAAHLGDLVQGSSVRYGGRPVKWLGDGVMIYFPDPAKAVHAALEMVQRLEPTGLPPAHVGVDAGPVVQQDGDYFGSTVNLAARIAIQAQASQVLVSRAVVDSVSDTGLHFAEKGRFELKGITETMALYEPRLSTA